jgi:putative addiction module antidote
MELKVTQVGNSLAVILPKNAAIELNVEKGDTLWLSESQSGFRITPYNPEFAEQMDAARKIMKKRRNVLRELSK